MSSLYENIITDSKFDQIIDSWTNDDIPTFDASTMGFNEIGTSTIYMKSSGTLCGKPFVNKIFKKFNCTIIWHDGFEEGSYITIPKNSKVRAARLSGKISDLLIAERLALNLLSECSGIATNCKKYQEIAKTCPGFTGVIAATRKVTPGFGLFQKYAVIVGGCDSHRLNISSMVMIKDNHRDACANQHILFSDYVSNIKKFIGFSQKIEIECRNMAEVKEAVVTKADIIMLDNFSPEQIQEACTYIKEKSNILIDVSGGINTQNLEQYLGPNIDIISMSELTRKFDYIDFSMKIDRKTFF